jgi:hypothetical protein
MTYEEAYHYLNAMMYMVNFNENQDPSMKVVNTAIKLVLEENKKLKEEISKIKNEN